MRHPLPDDVLAAMQRNEKLEAIRLLRGHVPLGLAEAKDAVETGYFDTPDPHAAGYAPMPLPETVVRALQAGDKIGAIKILRQTQGMGLKEAKDLIDLAGGVSPAGSGEEPLAPGEVGQTRGRKTWLIVIAMVIAGAVWYRLRHP